MVDHVLDLLFPSVASSTSDSSLLEALSGAGRLADDWELRCGSVRRQLHAAEAALPGIVTRDQAVATTLAAGAAAAEEDIRATLLATEGVCVCVCVSVFVAL